MMPSLSIFVQEIEAVWVEQYQLNDVLFSPWLLIMLELFKTMHTFTSWGIEEWRLVKEENNWIVFNRTLFKIWVIKCQMWALTTDYLSWIFSLKIFETEILFLQAHLQVVYCNCVKFHQYNISLSVKESLGLWEIWRDRRAGWFQYTHLNLSLQGL